MTLGFHVTDFTSTEDKFSVAGRFGTWEFEKNAWYDKILPELQKGQVGNTYSAFNSKVIPPISDADFAMAIDDLRDSCLLLSFLRATCVTPSVSTQYSFMQMLKLGDSFIPARAIRGYNDFTPSTSNSDFLNAGLPALSGANHRWLRLLMFHWISALSSYTLEDLFLATCVQFDIVKQAEQLISNSPSLTYAQGMNLASARLGIAPIQEPFQKMRNDLVHEGKLSGSNFSSKNKTDCANVVASCLNWLDQYVLASTGTTANVVATSRWRGNELEQYLPAFSLAP